jgi:hypothetical protein
MMGCKCQNFISDKYSEVNLILWWFDCASPDVERLGGATKVVAIQISGWLHLTPLHLDDWLVVGASGVLAGLLAAILPRVAYIMNRECRSSIS